MQIYWMPGRITVMVGTVRKMFVTRTLWKTVIKRSTSKDYALLIAFETPAVTAMILLAITTTALRNLD